MPELHILEVYCCANQETWGVFVVAHFFLKAKVHS
jgi:hypothetical protein